MNIDRNENQPLNGNEYISTWAKHEDSEEKMGESIQLTYKEAMAVFNHCIASHKKIGNAFQNFKNVQENAISEFPIDQDILINTVLDKFKSELYFLVKNAGQDSLSHYCFNATTRQFTTISEIIQFNRWGLHPSRCYINGNGNVTGPLSSNISDVALIAEAKKIEELWSKGTLIHTINQEDENQPSLSNVHGSILKKFSSIYDEGWMGGCYSNPSYTLLFPADVINFMQNRTKSSRSAI